MTMRLQTDTTTFTDHPLTGGPPEPQVRIRTLQGAAYWADSLNLMREMIKDQTVDMIMTSPPFGLVRKKEYGNADADEYLAWFRPFAEHFARILKPQGSFIIDIGGSWQSGVPTKSLYQYELLIMLCKEFGFHLAQEFFWWNPSRLPTPAEWVNIRRIRVKDAVNNIFWLSPTPWPKASNRRILTPYSSSMRQLLETGYRAKRRPSGHDIGKGFATDNGAAIPPNLLAVANTESNSQYISQDSPYWERLNGQPKRDGMIFGSCKATQSPVYPIRDAILAVNHASCPSFRLRSPANGVKAH